MKKVWVGVAAGALLLVAGVALRKHVKRLANRATDVVADAAATARQPAPLAAGEMLYDGKLGAGWDDWGWGPHRLAAGPAQVVFEGFGGIILHHAELSWQYGGLSFRFKAPADYDGFLRVALRWQGAPDDTFPLVSVRPRHIAKLDDGWQEVLIDWKELNPTQRAFDRVMISAGKAVGHDWILLDKVMLTKPAGSLPAPVDGRQVSLRVRCDGAAHPISPLIYGAASDEWSSGMSTGRMGGNTYSRFNWEIGAWNLGKDWFFENVQHQSVFAAIDDAAKKKHPQAVVVPILGFVAKDTTSSGFPKSKYAEQQKFDGYRAEAGNGLRPDGKPLPALGPELTSIPAPPELIGKWIERLASEDKARGSRNVEMYILDNEPTLWNETHRDAHPTPLSYDELLDRTIKYAEAIRGADPDAVIAGPAEWGWLGYMFSGKDREAGVGKKPDRLAHDDVPLVPWYLKKLAEREGESGKRLLDVLDLHFYPAANGVYGPAADDATAELRLRSTRALWDPKYNDESWIKEPIGLIPRMKAWVASNRPGLKLSIGEWCFGAEQHISGGLATAEALGRFGQQGLDAAFFWGDLKEGIPTYWAFRAFRNFDGKGAHFQDLSLPVTEADSENVSLFASRDPASTKYVLVVINRDLHSSINASIELEGCDRFTSSRAFTYSGGVAGLAAGRVKVTPTGAVEAPVDAFSLSVIELGTGAAP
jgi:hypothetical protein